MMTIENNTEYKIMELVTGTYMTHGDIEETFQSDVLRVTLEKGNNTDSVTLYVNGKPKMIVDVKGTTSEIVSFDYHDSNALKYVAPFAKSLGIPKTRLRQWATKA
ncbi:MAG: hypothetical protein LBM95_00020 [Lactobacillales bacterium]|jgi:hypothetical protein|nr:hypothetical protein [Lactobacillales bacterium]